LILNELKIRDFGVFSGQHSIDLTPRIKYGRKRPIVLFGGLNGAGKTTTLTAVRLALYGRASLGRNISQQTYHEQLVDYIHKPKKSVVAPHSSSVELSFTYGKHGSINNYKIIRNWEHQKNKVIEHLDVHQDGASLEGLNAEQLQSFLNELIPIGVADLFFFDGEKIADLAEDTTNEALAYAIKRLLGLDIVDRLRADLGIYLKENTQSKLPKDISKELKNHEESYTENYRLYQDSLTASQILKTKITASNKDIEALTLRINDLGGAWAKSRQAEELRSDQLIKERNNANNEIRELFADSIPLAMAPKSLSKLLAQLNAEAATKANISARREISKHLIVLKKELAKSTDKRDVETAVEKSFGGLLDTKRDATIIHDISEKQFQKIHNLIESYVPQQVAQAKKLSNRVEALQKQLDTAAKNIARAPDQSRIDHIVKELNEFQSARVLLEKQLTANNEVAKKYLRDAMDSLRRLKELDEKFRKSMSHGQGVELASNTRSMLEEFGEKTKLRKLEILEQEFIKSFSKLARKDDMDIQAHIDPQTFSVTLTDTHGKTINKKKLSAGERQIYAIAMLEALGRTSGRNLPIIIDTPLGRLDSKHRTNLIKNYFPTASHQVLILSTDTEIDEAFYNDLSTEISHAFSVDYDSSLGNSKFNEGYFWRQN
jgi:DNA sulfur modification protein DndD